MTATLPSLLTSAFLHLSLHVYWYWELLQLQCLSLFSFNLLFYYLCQIPKSLNHLVHSLMIESCLPMQSYLLAKEHFFHILPLWEFGDKPGLGVRRHLRYTIISSVLLLIISFTMGKLSVRTKWDFSGMSSLKEGQDKRNK